LLNKFLSQVYYRIVIGERFVNAFWMSFSQSLLDYTSVDHPATVHVDKTYLNSLTTVAACHTRGLW